jgi:hypothetical protein
MALAWPVGELALAGGRMGAQLRNYHHYAERIVRGASQPRPVVLKPETRPILFGEEPADASSLKALLSPFHRAR